MDDSVYVSRGAKSWYVFAVVEYRWLMSDEIKRLIPTPYFSTSTEYEM